MIVKNYRSTKVIQDTQGYALDVEYCDLCRY